MAIGTLVTRTGVAYGGKLRAYSIAHGAISVADFIPGELVEQAVSLATARVVYSETNKLFVRDVTGTFNDSGEITGATSGAKATATAVLSTSASWMAAYLTLGRLRDTVSVSRSRDVTTISDFDTAEDSFQDQIAGNQNANMSGTMNIEPGGATFAFFEQAMDGDLDVAIKRELTDRAGENVRTRYYQGIVTQFNEQDSVTDASTVSFTLALNDSAFTDPTA
jgi:hypothetical protein